MNANGNLHCKSTGSSFPMRCHKSEENGACLVLLLREYCVHRRIDNPTGLDQLKQVSSLDKSPKIVKHLTWIGAQRLYKITDAIRMRDEV